MDTRKIYRLAYKTAAFFQRGAKRERHGAAPSCCATRRAPRTRLHISFSLHRMLRIDHPSSLHGVSHDNMSRDSDQGLRRRRGRRKTNISGHKLRFIPAPAIIYNPPYRITFQSIIYGDSNLYKVFRALLLFESCIEPWMRDRCQVRHCGDCYRRKIREKTLRAFFTVTTKLSRITKVGCESEILEKRILYLSLLKFLNACTYLFYYDFNSQIIEKMYFM